MPALSSTALFLFQDTPGSANDLHWIMIFTGVIAVCIALVLLSAVIGAVVALSKISKIAKDAEAKAQPFLAKGQELLGHTNQIVADLKPKIASISTDLQPKIASVSSDVQHISGIVRSKGDQVAATLGQINETVQDTNSKTRAQISRVNGLVAEALTTTHEVSRTVQDSIKMPVKQVAGVIAGIKAALETLAQRSPLGKTRTVATPVPVPVVVEVEVSRVDLT